MCTYTHKKAFNSFTTNEEEKQQQPTTATKEINVHLICYNYCYFILHNNTQIMYLFLLIFHWGREYFLVYKTKFNKDKYFLDLNKFNG